MAEKKVISKQSATIKHIVADLFHKKDIYLSLILIAFGTIMFYEATKFPAPPLVLGDTINADVFPKILVVMLFFLALIIPFEYKFALSKIEKIDKERDDKVLPITWITIIMLLVIVSISNILGAALTMFVTALAFPIVWGERNYIAISLYAIIFPLCVFLLFNKLLGLYFEPGLLKFLTTKG